MSNDSHGFSHHEIFLSWIRGWARSRAAPPPVAHADGFRIEVGQPQQAARYVFSGRSPALSDLGRTITQPWVFLKACATSDELRALLPAHWRIEDQHWMMTCDARPFPGPAGVPAGYVLHVQDDTARTGHAHVRIDAPDGSLAASGHIGLHDPLAIYDRILTDPGHQRRGLGRAVMHALQALARLHWRHAGALVATDQGRALYESLGWRLHAPWAGAVIPGSTVAG